MWDSKTKYSKSTVANILCKRYWGEIHVSSDLKKKLSASEWYREKFRREVKKFGGYVWTRNKQRNDDIENKNLMYWDTRISKGEIVTVNFSISNDIKVEVICEVFIKTSFTIKCA